MMHTGFQERMSNRQRLASTRLFIVPRPQPVVTAPRFSLSAPDSHSRVLTLLASAAAVVPIFWVLRELMLLVRPH